MNPYPAIVIGGPPHSGKSVLIYSLTQALRQRRVAHYVLRACPDGEGDWANEAQQLLVQQIRLKGEWSAEWVAAMKHDIANRHLPLLVDVGGKPTLEQESIFEPCSHAILLTRDDASRAEWQKRMACHHVPVIADLRSRLDGETQLESSDLPIGGILTGLQRSAQAQGVLFDRLVDYLAQLCQTDAEETRRKHLASVPVKLGVELAVDLDRLSVTLGALDAEGKSFWQPQQIVSVLDYLPHNEPIALYGRATNWLYAAIARAIFPHAFWCFDIRLGWVRALSLPQQENPQHDSIRYHVQEHGEYTQLEIRLPLSYLHYRDLPSLSLPRVNPNKGLLISGKLPLWFYGSLAQSYSNVPYLAIYQPPLAGYVKIFSRTNVGMGEIIKGVS